MILSSVSSLHHLPPQLPLSRDVNRIFPRPLTTYVFGPNRRRHQLVVPRVKLDRNRRRHRLIVPRVGVELLPRLLLLRLLRLTELTRLRRWNVYHVRLPLLRRSIHHALWETPLRRRHVHVRLHLHVRRHVIVRGQLVHAVVVVVFHIMMNRFRRRRWARPPFLHQLPPVPGVRRLGGAVGIPTALVLPVVRQVLLVLLQIIWQTCVRIDVNFPS